MSRTIHLQLDIRGALLNWTPSEWVGVARADDGRHLTAQEFKAELLDRLARGERYLPYGNCPTFDPVTGCPGHDSAD